MLVKGDKIKLVKEINGFNKLGEIFEVSEILDGGTISFRCWFGTGLMSYDEYEKHFEKIVERKWSKWIMVNFKNDNINLGHIDHSPYQYRTNGKKIVLKNGSLEVSSSCNETDTFDLFKGLQLCFARMKVKEIIANM